MEVRSFIPMFFFILTAFSIFSQHKGKRVPTNLDYQLLFNSISGFAPENGDFILKLDSAKITLTSKDLQRFRIGISPSKHCGYHEYDGFVTFSIYLIPKIKENKILKYEKRNQKTISEAINLQKTADKKAHPLDSNNPIVLNFLCKKLITTPTHSYNDKFDILVIEEKANYFTEIIYKETLATITSFFEDLDNKHHQINPNRAFIYVGTLYPCIKK